MLVRQPTRTASVNWFELEVVPPLAALYRGSRNAISSACGMAATLSGPFAYTTMPTADITEESEVSLSVVRDLIHRQLRRALERSESFFDVSSYGLSATIQRKILHGEETF